MVKNGLKRAKNGLKMAFLGYFLRFLKIYSRVHEVGFMIGNHPIKRSIKIIYISNKKADCQS
jgi:hypothetical protein